MEDSNEQDKQPLQSVSSGSKSVLQPPAEDAAREPTATAHTVGSVTLAGTDHIAPKQSFSERLKSKLKAFWANPKKRYSAIAAVVIIIAALFAIPFTRYEILGLVLKSHATITVLDSKTGQPVSGATVSIGGGKTQTDADGKAEVSSHLGYKSLTVSKKYFAAYSHRQQVVIAAAHNSFTAKVLALGLQVQVKIKNEITGNPVANVAIDAKGAKAKTNSNGMATLVLAADAGSVKTSLTLDGYNTQSVTLTAGGSSAQNTFSITPAGKVYFLSNLSGDIDVVKTNLDGSDRQTVVRGTGYEDRNDTSLLASRDWKYLALLSKRDASATTAAVYLIDTTNGDKLTPIDQSNATFTLAGWSGDSFIYGSSKNNANLWQSSNYALKSFDATSGRTTLLDQSTAEGTSATDYGYDNFSNVYILNNEIFYAKNWFSSSQTNHLSGKSATLTSIRPDGSGHKVVQSFAVPDGVQYYSINLSLYEPDGVYVQVPSGTANTYYEYENGVLNPRPDVTDGQFGAPYPTYLVSPSGNSTFWAEQRDGKNTLFTGTSSAANKKQIATLSQYNPYGWYSDSYLLVSKNSSELYILPVGGGTPKMVSDYYKPPINYSGYGGGYGGL